MCSLFNDQPWLLKERDHRVVTVSIWENQAHIFSFLNQCFPFDLNRRPFSLFIKLLLLLLIPGGVLPGNLGEGVRPTAGTVTLFQTKICDFPYPISDLTPNSIPYFRTDPYPISFSSTFENFFKFQTMTKSHISGEEH